MDHDSVDHRLRRVERFLDANADGWREENNWRRGSVRVGGESKSKSDSTAELKVDEDQTKQDREALGITDDTILRGGHFITPQASAAAGPAAGMRPGIDDGKDAELRQNARAGKGAVSNERLQQQERAELLSRLEQHRGKPGFPELSGAESNDQLRSMLDTAERTGSAATAVALEGARANPAAEQALQTAQSPERQERAEAQQDQRKAIDAGGGPRPQPAR